MSRIRIVVAVVTQGYYWGFTYIPSWEHFSLVYTVFFRWVCKTAAIFVYVEAGLNRAEVTIPVFFDSTAESEAIHSTHYLTLSQRTGHRDLRQLLLR